MSYLPIILKSERQHALVAGSSLNAIAKVRLLLEKNIRVTVIAPDATATLQRANLAGNSAWTNLLDFEDRTVEDADLEGRTLFYIVVHDVEEQKRLLDLGQQARVPTTVVDAPRGSDFINPAVVSRGPVTVAFSTGGKAPVFARRLRADLEKLLPRNLGNITEVAGSIRDRIAELISDSTARREFWDRLYDEADHPRFAHTDRAALKAEIIDLAREFGHGSRVARGLIQLVGAGPGDPELLTIRALRALQKADVIVYDKLVSEDIVALGRRDAQYVYVGKERGDHGPGQRSINDLLVSEARQGRRVVRLKSGDPMIFGRAGEELDAARKAGLEVEVISGITALAGISATSQIPLTHRDHAQAVTLVTGHLKDFSSQDFRGLAGPGRTLAIYMGLSTATEIQGTLLQQGLAASLPVAIIENGTRSNERRFHGTLAGLAQLVTGNSIQSPALIIVGETTALALDQVHRDDLQLSA